MTSTLTRPGGTAVLNRASSPPQKATPDPASKAGGERAAAYPPAERLALVERRHGHEVADPYRWLEEPTDPRSVAWLTAQREFADQHRPCEPLLADLTGKLRAYSNAGIVSPPAWRGERQFVMRREPGQEMPVVYLTEPDGTERALLDPLALDPSGMTTLDDWKVSPDGRLVAYQVSHRGTEWSLLYVADIDTGRLVDGPIDRLRRAPLSWAPDSSGFWYVRRLPGNGQGSLAPRRLLWHRIGHPADDAAIVFGHGEPATTGLWPRLFAQRWLTVRVTNGASAGNALWVADVAGADPAGLVFYPVVTERRMAVTPAIGGDGRMYLHTTSDAARGRLSVVALADLRRLGPEHWRPLLGEDPDAVLLGVVPLAGGEWGPERLFVLRARHGTGEAAVHDAYSGALLEQIRLPRPGILATPVPHPDGGKRLWMMYTDHETPSEVVRYDLAERDLSVHARPPGTVPPRRVTTRQVTYRSEDGTEVRMFVIAPESCQDGPDHPRPTLLTGYGGFRVSMVPQYRADAMAWTAAGGVFAVACVRGGEEEGAQWHAAGTGAGKRRAVEDFNAAAEWLIGAGWTRPEMLAAMGASNGGLLVTAAMVERPELYQAVAASAPLTDMVRYERSGLGGLWRSEYGTAEDPEQFEALLSYSPYHRVRPGVAYPAVLLTVPEADTRVDPMHGYKLCAALQHASTGGPVVLRSLRDTGHGARGHSAALASAAETLAFLAEQTGLAGAAGTLTGTAGTLTGADQAGRPYPAG